MLYHGKKRCYLEELNEFKWIKNANLSKDEKLKELVDLRNYLKVTYTNIGISKSIENRILDLIDDIDSYWWDLFTRENGGQV